MSMSTYDWHSSLIASDREGGEAFKILRRIYEGENPPMVEIGQLLKQRKDRLELAAASRSKKEADRERRNKVGRAKSGKFEVAPRYENGTDFSADGIVLARMGTTRLVWRYAGKHWGNQLSGYVSHGATLELHQNTSLHKRLPRSLAEDGRLTSKRLTEPELAGKIDAIFGAGAAVRIAELKGTVVFEDKENDK